MVTDAFFITWLYHILHYPFSGVEINEDKPNEHRGHLFRARFNKGLSRHHLQFGRDLSQAEDQGNFMVKKREGFRYALIGGTGMRKVEASYLEVRHLIQLVWGEFWLSLVGPRCKGNGDPELEAKWLGFLN